MSVFEDRNFRSIIFIFILNDLNFNVVFYFIFKFRNIDEKKKSIKQFNSMEYIIDFLVFDNVFHIKIFYFSNYFTPNMSLYSGGYDRKSLGYLIQTHFDNINNTNKFIIHF